MSNSAEAVDRPDLPSGHQSPRATPSLAIGLIRLARPRQWIKNLLVFVAPAAAGVLLHGHVLWPTVAAFAIFCVAASGTYYLNDAIDAPVDSAHPTKHVRPVASGVVPAPLAVTAGLGLVVVATVLGGVLTGWHLALVIGIYGVINVAYSLGLRNEPIVDLAIVSAGFVLRAVAGGLAAHVALSNWFLIVTSFGSLLIVTGKRSGEKQLLDEHRTDGDTVRQTLGMYSASFLRTVRTLTAAVTVTAYCLWAFERAAELHPARDPIWFQLTIVPFTIAVLHVLRLLDSGEGSTPEDLALQDHRLQIYGLSWVALFAIGIYS